MKTKNFVTKTFSLLVTCGAVAVCGNPATSQTPPPNTATANTEMNFAATTVASECSVTIPPASDPVNSPGTPIPYTVNYTPGGVNGDIYSTDYPTGPGVIPTQQEDRATSMTASDSVTFDCNTVTVNLSIGGVGTTVNAPVIYPAGLTFQHEIDYTLSNGNSANQQSLPVNLNGENTDQDGDLQVDITSRFQALGEELPQGTYGPTTIKITATAI